MQLAEPMDKEAEQKGAPESEDEGSQELTRIQNLARQEKVLDEMRVSNEYSLFQKPGNKTFKSSLERIEELEMSLSQPPNQERTFQRVQQAMSLAVQ